MKTETKKPDLDDWRRDAIALARSVHHAALAVLNRARRGKPIPVQKLDDVVAAACALRETIRPHAREGC